MPKASSTSDTFVKQSFGSLNSFFLTFIVLQTLSLFDINNDVNRCGVIQEGDRIIAINGQYLEGRTMEEIYGFITESPVKMILTIEFRVAGMF